MDKMRVLVIGATDFIGSNFVSRLGPTRKDLYLRTITRGAKQIKEESRGFEHGDC